MYQKLDGEKMMDEIPAALKEDVLYFQFGKLINMFYFLQELNN